MKRDILFLCQFSYPEVNSSATLPFDTAKYLAEQGYSVDVLCGYPKEYNLTGSVPLRESVGGVNIHRIKYIQLERGKKLSRLINYFSFTVSAFFRLAEIGKYKTVIVYSNPPVLPLVSVAAKLIHKTKIIFVAYDLYPEVAYASKTIRSGDILDRVMKVINTLLFKNVTAVVALTDEMKKFLLEHRSTITDSQVVVIPNWAHEKELIADHEAYRRFGYSDDQFVVSYFGNMGICQEMNTFMRAIELLKDDKRVKFLLVGHGSKKTEVEDRIGKFENVQVINFLTGREFQQAVAVSSACVVSLERGLMGMCAPSKYYSYLQGGQPVLAVVEKESYLAKEVTEKKIGKAIEIGQSSEMATAIIELLDNPEECKKIGLRAKQLYDDEYKIDLSLDKYHKLLKKILGK